MDSAVAPPDGFVVDSLPHGFVVDQGDTRLAMQDDLARAADRATAAKRNPAKDPDVLALQARLEKLPAFGSAESPPPDGFVVDQAVSPAKDDLYGKAKAMLQQGPQQLSDLLTGENALPVLLGKFAGYVSRKSELTNEMRAPDADGVSPIEREIQRRKDAGEPTDFRSIETWMDQTIEKKLFPAKPVSVDPLEYGKQVVQGVIDHPLDAAKGFVSYAVTHPEVLAAGPIGGLLLMAGESVVEQKTDSGKVDASKLLVDTTLNAVPILAIHAAVRAGNLRAAKTTGAEPTAKVEEQALTAINAKTKEGISEGQAPADAATAALDDVLAVMKIAPEERAAIVEGAKDAIDQGQKPQGDRIEHQGTGVDRTEAVAGDSDSAASGREVAQEVRPGPLDRRQDMARRAAVADMSPSEMRQALLTDPLTGLPNRRAYTEASKKPITSSIDVDGLKWVNDNLGHEAGDQLLKAVGDALNHVEGYHLSGDEFVAQFDHPSAAKAGMAEFQRKLNNISLEFTTPEGKTVSIDGIGASHGIGDSISTADAALRASKLSREATGERKARGEQPPGVAGSERIARPADRGFAAGEPIQAGGGQAGRVDPKLLAAVGIAGVGAAYGYWLNKDPADAVRGALIAGGAAAGGLALRRVGSATGALFSGLKDARYRIGHLTDDFSGQLKLGEWGTYRLQKALEAMVPDVKRREAITHAYQAGDTASLSPVEQQYVAVLAKAFEQGAELSKSTGSPIQSLIENYITQFWVKGLNTKESLLENLKRAMDASGQTSPGMSPNTRFAKQRVIPNYKAGIEAGLVPVTLDSAAIVRMYLDNINKAVQNKKLIDALGREKNTLGEPIAVKGDVLEAEVKRRAEQALDGTPLDDGAKRMVGDIDAIKAPSDYQFINHPQMRNVKVHPDVAAPLKALFDSNDANAATRAAYAVSIAAKRGLFSFSLFHAKSLLDAMLGTSPGGWAKVPGALKMLREGENAGLRDLIQGGLNVVTRPLEADASAFANGMRVLEAKMPLAALPIKGVRWIQEHMDNFLWGVVHPSFKIAAALAAYEKQVMKRPNVPRAQIAKEVASYANDIFGGLDWFKIADGVQNRYGRDLALALGSPSGRRFMQIAMLAPDWTVATTRAMAKAIPGVSTPEIAAMHRGYVLRSALVYLMVADGLNQAFSGHHLWDNKDPTMVDMGDGRRMQLSKHFMEPVHWLTKPGQQLLNKLGYVVKEPLTQAMHTEYLSTTGAPPMENRALHALKGVLPIPSQVAMQTGGGTALSGALGVPIYGKTQEQAVDAAIERALNLRQKRLESDDPAEQAKARKKSQSDTAAAATSRVNRQYQKQRDEQRQRESR